ncbi:MAG: Cyclic di-GMP phosphodiesterase [Rhodocyclaceae bacterium]|nr:MAG: HD-GYP domain-containing protein [Rhodocyclaceae bacterium]MBV6406532.1 Cyclic di-GMP phosphodiesterase [Rhodocyclaceae bacterium]CAG0943905.1 Cyclic di-GMP phosphodiesterase [Gammaproteobacteria bacterium]
MAIKKIPAARLKPGMFIHDLDCGWMDHPFLTTRFKLDSERDLRKIHAAGIREVYVDTELGLDVADAPTAGEVSQELEREMELAVEKRPEPRASTHEELARARNIHSEANRIMRSMMNDVRLGRQVHVEQIEPMVDKMAGSILRNSGALISLNRIKNKDEYTFQHSVSVATLLMAFCRGLGLDEETLRQAGIGGMVHDVGKMQTPDGILNKPGKLTDDEFAVMRHHVVASREILEITPNISQTALQVAAQHHERYDGSGYPGRLKGDEISRIGQMAAIIDVYDAITSDRVYHKGMPPTEALRKLFEWSKFHFNPELVHAFARVVGIYPVGALVRLESERLAVVVEQRESNMLQPLLRVVFDARRNHYLKPEDVDLSRSMGKGGADRILGHESPDKWQIDPMKFL